MTLEEYLTSHHKTGRKFKNQQERKKYLRSIGVKLVRHPKKNEEMVAVEAEMQLLSGKRLAASRIKEDDHTGDKQAAKEGFEKASTSLSTSNKINTKAGSQEKVAS